MDPNNPSNFINSLPPNSMGGQLGGQPAPAPQPQPAPFNPAQYATPPAPQPGDNPGNFAPPASGAPDIFGDGQRGAPMVPPANQPWVPGPAPAPGTVPAGTQGVPALPGAPAYSPAQVPAPAGSEQPPAWALELAEMIRENGGQQPPAGQQPGADWKPKDWNEVLDKAKETVRAELDAEKAAQTTQQQQEEARVNEIMRDLDNQLQGLAAYGQIPQIANPSDVNDPGRVYRRELMGYANAAGSTNLTVLNQALVNAHRAGYVFDPQAAQFVPANGQPAQAPSAPSYPAAPAAPAFPAYTPAGQNTPIAGGSVAAGAPSSDLPPLTQLRNASVGELMQGLTAETASYFG